MLSAQEKVIFIFKIQTDEKDLKIVGFQENSKVARTFTKNEKKTFHFDRNGFEEDNEIMRKP